ncbi:hypothetical protein DPMN_135965 [Dreissena polymorpha]|uniref:Uncharacterized protein n=1 Tax=Dreissena polymorpha TaxID=45954 RepID=A0A9D4JF49_DREPO|nr:hypothetical protein DPMN_135965 [Dreissena polymorpha]
MRLSLLPEIQRDRERAPSESLSPLPLSRDLPLARLPSRSLPLSLLSLLSLSFSRSEYHRPDRNLTET